MSGSHIQYHTHWGRALLFVHLEGHTSGNKEIGGKDEELFLGENKPTGQSKSGMGRRLPRQK
jgi:hypothetical protein